MKNNEKTVEEIIKEDKIEELQKLIREQDIDSKSQITKSFNEVEEMNIPIFNECIIQKAMKCFKYLLINEIGDPTTTMQQAKYSFPNSDK